MSLCACRKDHLVPRGFDRDYSPQSRFTDQLAGKHDLGPHLCGNHLGRHAGTRATSNASSKKEPNTTLLSRSIPQKFTEQRAAAEQTEPDLWQLQEPLAPLAGSGGPERRDDFAEALLKGATTSADPFEKQDDDPALADRRYRSISRSASSSSRISAFSEGDSAFSEGRDAISMKAPLGLKECQLSVQLSWESLQVGL